MREPARIKRILEKLNTLWEVDTDSRFMQLLHNLQQEYSQKHNNFGLIEGKNNTGWGYDMFYLEDDYLEEFLDDKIKNMKK